MGPSRLVLKKKKNPARKEIFIVRRGQGHMQVSFYETAANCFSSFFCLFSLVVFALFTCLFVSFVFYDLSVVGFHVTPLKFKLRNYRSFRDFTFTMH